MTRINCGIDPKTLSDKHLLAEHREIKRIPNAIRKGKFNLKNQPKTFKLGTGHVKFFYDKLLYLKKRYDSLYQECKHRKFNVTYYGSAWCYAPGLGSPLEPMMNDYIPTQYDIDIIQARLDEKNGHKHK
jgi:deoxyribonuclease (pyrimidine dimer)